MYMWCAFQTKRIICFCILHDLMSCGSVTCCTGFCDTQHIMLLQAKGYTGMYLKEIHVHVYNQGWVFCYIVTPKCNICTPSELYTHISRVHHKNTQYEVFSSLMYVCHLRKVLPESIITPKKLF